MEKIKEAEKHPMSREEIQKGLDDLQALLSNLENDLAKAEKKADDRLAVKVTKYSSMTLAGYALIGSFLNSKPNGNVIQQGLYSVIYGTAYFLSFWIIVGGSSYIFLTNKELHKLRRIVHQLKYKVKSLKYRLS